MKKTFVAVVLCMALLSSFTVSASAYDVNDIYNQVTAIRNELGYPQGNWSSLRRAINYIADHLPSSPIDYSTILSNIKSNSVSIVSTLSDIYGVNSGLVQRVIEIQSKIDVSNQHLGTISSSLGSIDSHIGSGFELNHNDLTSFYNRFITMFGSSSLGDTDAYKYYCDLFDPATSSYLTSSSLDWGHFLPVVAYSLAFDSGDNVLVPSYEPSLYHRIKQLQLVLASDDDLQLKQDRPL